jgi:hypothetical protein
MLPFSLKASRQANTLQVPQRGPYGEKYPLTGHFYLPLNISLFIFPSESPVREPPPCSPWAATLRNQSHWSTFYSFVYVYRSPQKGALQHTRAVHKETELFLTYSFTYNLIKLVSFKVLPSILDTPLTTFLLVLERVLEHLLLDGAKVPYRIFLYRLKSATF